MADKRDTEIQINLDTVGDQLRRVVQDGNARRVFIYTSEGRLIMSLSLTAFALVALVGLFVTPLITVGVVVAAFLSRINLKVLRGTADDDSDTTS